MSLIINSYNFGVPYTARTTAFLAATGISDTTIANALNTFDLYIIANGLDSILNFVYPLVGGTATTHKYNFMNTANFQITWVGGITHDANGVTGNGTTGYGDSGYVPSTYDSLDNSAYGFYCRSNEVGTYSDMGCVKSTLTTAIASILYRGAISEYINTNDFSVGVPAFMSDIRRTNIITRTSSSTLVDYYRDNNLILNIYAPSTELPDNNIFLLGRNYLGAVNIPSVRNYSFFFKSTGMDATQRANMRTAIDNLQLALGRNV